LDVPGAVVRAEDGEVGVAIAEEVGVGDRDIARLAPGHLQRARRVPISGRRLEPGPGLGDVPGAVAGAVNGHVVGRAALDGPGEGAEQLAALEGLALRFQRPSSSRAAVTKGTCRARLRPENPREPTRQVL